MISVRTPRTNKELQMLAKQWFFRCFHCKGLFDIARAPKGEYFCRECKAAHVRAQRGAIAAMAKARRHGLLQDQPEDFTCVDCGVQAEMLEHRNYARPLDVEPTCRSCNVLRGPAIWQESAA